MKYTTFLFRDLENSIVLVRPDPDTKKLDFHVIDSKTITLDDLPHENVQVVSVNEPQEDIFELKPLFKLKVVAENNNPINLASLAESDEESFRKIIDNLYQTANTESVSVLSLKLA